MVKLKLSLLHHDIVNHYEICVTHDNGYVPVLSFMTYHLKLNTTSATSGTGNAISSGTHEFIPLNGLRVFLSLAFCGVGRPFLVFFYCLSICDLGLFITFSVYLSFLCPQSCSDVSYTVWPFDCYFPLVSHGV